MYTTVGFLSLSDIIRADSLTFLVRFQCQDNFQPPFSYPLLPLPQRHECYSLRSITYHEIVLRSHSHILSAAPKQSCYWCRFSRTGLVQATDVRRRRLANGNVDLHPSPI